MAKKRTKVWRWPPQHGSHEGMPYLLKKCLEKILAGDFTKLPPGKWKVKSIPHAVEGQIVVIQAVDLSESRKLISNLAKWFQCYSVYAFMQQWPLSRSPTKWWPLINSTTQHEVHTNGGLRPQFLLRCITGWPERLVQGRAKHITHKDSLMRQSVWCRLLSFHNILTMLQIQMPVWSNT